MTHIAPHTPQLHAGGAGGGGNVGAGGGGGGGGGAPPHPTARVLGRALQHLSFPVHFKVNYANSWWYSTVPSWPGSWGGLCQRNLTRYVTDCTASVLDVINEVVEEVSQSLNEQMVRKLSNFINEEELSKLSVTAYWRGFYMGGHSDFIGDHHWDFEGVPSGQTYIINIMVEVHSHGLRIRGHRTERYQKRHRMLGN